MKEKNFIDQEDIDSLLSELKNYNNEKSIIRIKPSDINKISDYKKRKQTKDHFNLVQELFVLPLEEMLFFFRLKNNKFAKTFSSDNNLNIIGRVHYLQQSLKEHGFDQYKLIELVPQSTEEIEILLKAKQAGFKPSTTLLTNEEKIKEAQDYLDNIYKRKNSYHKLTEYLPKSIKEVELLLEAKHVGFKPSNKYLTEKEKLEEAKKYLEDLKTKSTRVRKKY